ncbi:MAG TPA: ABC transporter ATP-binding protein [Phycisphaerales bacterium]|nr:ABC transporter ATP-binding protein [Phycisphaerales bacterium]
MSTVTRHAAIPTAPEARPPAGVALLSVRDLHKTYRLGRVEVPVLRGATIEVREGEWVAVLGASGSGKSTLLHLMGGLDRPDSVAGERHPIRFDGRPLSEMSAGELDRYRAESVGFVFQFYHLLPELNVLENVLLGAMVLHGRFGYSRRRGALRARATDLLASFGLSHRLSHRPAEISGGERQRVAIARALMNEPRLLLADEPTGNLDRETGRRILDAIAGVRGGPARTIVMVTHDPEVAARADRIVHLEDGRVVAGSI